MAPTYVQAAQNSGSGSTTVGSGQGWSTPTSGNLLTMHIVADNTRSTPSGWSLATSGVSWSGNYLFYRISDGTESSVSSGSGSGALTMIVTEHDGNETSSVLDRTSSGSFGESATSASTGSTATTTIADEVLVAGVGGYAATSRNVTAWSSSFVERGDLYNNPNPNAVASRIVSSTGAYSTTATFSGTVSNGYALLATFKGTAGGGTTYGGAFTVPSTAGMTVAAPRLVRPAAFTVAAVAAVAVDPVAVHTPAVTIPAVAAVAVDGRAVKAAAFTVAGTAGTALDGRAVKAAAFTVAASTTVAMDPVVQTGAVTYPASTTIPAVAAVAVDPVAVHTPTVTIPAVAAVAVDGRAVKAAAFTVAATTTVALSAHVPGTYTIRLGTQTVDAIYRGADPWEWVPWT